MKRIIAISLCMVFVLCLCGCCGGKNKEKDGIDIEYYANLGQIPENDVVLGTTYEELIAVLDKRGAEAEKNGEDYGYNEFDGENNVLIAEGPYDYYYKKADPKKEIGYMIAYGTAFGFEKDEVILNVENALKKFDYTKESANEQNAFFYFGDYSKAEVLKVNFEKTTVIFLFEESVLTATAIYSNDIWK
mgnify:FL=1